ncbi:hypothetical protein FHL15_005135 [Xylaria flabelliformis]|uniref:Uncharacterized protein n=1 Tax=Xylaria flabelliformis TaxID=2512241 RepID=A0A553I1K4_9PEZI|nr:hypothetical protein FHL15_005135 [Xylaria flabelliformis]
MFYKEIKFAAVVTAVLILGAWAGEPDLFYHMQRDPNIGLFARQDQSGGQIGLSNLNACASTPRYDTRLVNPRITLSDDPQHPYSVNGQQVSDFNTAIDKTCDFQKNDCSELANGAQKGQISVSDCDDQSSQCKSFLKASATQTAFLSMVTVAGNDDFDFICEN